MCTVKAGLPIFVGLLWGVTNPLIRRGALVAARAPVKPVFGSAPADQLLHHLRTPAFLLPQLANLLASALFAWSLGASAAPVSLAAPVANGVSLAVNAAAERLILGDSLRPWPGLPGLLLVLAGVTLCTLA